MFSLITDGARQASIYQAYAASAASYARVANRQYPSPIQYSSTKTIIAGNCFLTMRYTVFAFNLCKDLFRNSHFVILI